MRVLAACFATMAACWASDLVFAMMPARASTRVPNVQQGSDGLMAPRAQGSPRMSPIPVRRADVEDTSHEVPLAALGGLAAAATAAVGLAARRRSRNAFAGRRGPGRTRSRADAGPYALVKSPRDTYLAMVDKGVANSNMTVAKTFVASVFGGAYVGMAGLLSLAISGNMGATSMSTQKFVFAALFPVNLLLVLQSGAQLFTGNSATMTMGYIEGKVSLKKLLRNWGISYLGNLVGCLALALVTYYTGLLTMGTADLAVATVLKKCGSHFGPVVVKAIMCNWLVCMAVYLASSASDLTGKMVGIWFPISMFVAIGFEHSVANMFLLPAGLMAGAPLTVMEALFKNLIPVSLGNLIAGAVVIAGGLGFLHGKLGEGR